MGPMSWRCSAGYIHKWDENLVIAMSADALAPNNPVPSAGSMLTTEKM